MKYWIIRNSYGPNWGAKGDFLAERGVNFMNLESEATAYDAALCGEVNC
jgi:C1A family cysteine protease